MNWWEDKEYDKVPPMTFPKHDESKRSVPLKVGPCQTREGKCACKTDSRVFVSAQDCPCFRMGCDCG